MNKLVTTIFLCLPFISANAASIEWRFEAGVSATSVDPLGIDGEIVAMKLTFDDASTWTNYFSDDFFLPALSAEASITGGHSISLNSDMPAAYYDLPNQGSFSEAVATPNFIDFIIDGNVTQMINFIGLTADVPADGQKLLPTHLITDLCCSAGFNFVQGSSPTQYTFTNATIEISVVPIPAAALLFGSALSGLVLTRYRKTKR